MPLCCLFFSLIYLVDSVKEEIEEPKIEPSLDKMDDQDMKPADENGHTGDNRQSLATVFRMAALLGKKNSSVSHLSEEDRELFIQELSMCHWFGRENKCIPSIGDGDMVNLLINGIRDVILKEMQESPFFSLITDKPVQIADKTHLPVFVRYVGESAPKVELMGLSLIHI